MHKLFLVLLTLVTFNTHAGLCEKDIETFSKKDVDGFELHLRNIIKKHLGSNFEKHLKYILVALNQIYIELNLYLL